LYIVSHENDYVSHFYENYEGRVALGVGYDQNISEIYPFVFEDSAGNSIGAVALGVCILEGLDYVHIYHIGAFKSHRGNGSRILKELCFQADKHQIILSLSPIFMPNGKDNVMSDERLRQWYGRYGFKGRSHFKREPRII
jgi:hypothetical protein